jgi:UDP-N-acetylmuramoylalanine--D-glutamate ligase
MAKIAILGGGESGVGAALLAQAKGFEVFLSDRGVLAPTYQATLEAAGIAFESGQHSPERILDADEVIKSPGIPDKAPLVQQCVAQGIPLISEIEFAARYTRAKLIAITGSNGKTTTTSLTYHLLQSAGLSVGLGGNIGESFAKQVIEDPYDYFVLEISSFQLDNCLDFKPYIAMLLNITSDHLDRYEYRFESYVDAKFRIIQRQEANDFFIYFAGSEPIQQRLATLSLRPKALPIALGSSAGVTAYADDQKLVASATTWTFEMARADLPIKGPHNALNALCAIQTAQILGLTDAQIRAGLLSFAPVAHRLEPVATVQGIRYINDSKATNVDSVYYALGSFEQPIVLILGGIDKGNDYTQIEALVRQKVKNVVALGIDNVKIKAFFEPLVGTVPECHSMAEALETARQLATSGDVVLLSPACASFDLFKNYEDRGQQFREAVLALPV